MKTGTEKTDYPISGMLLIIVILIPVFFSGCRGEKPVSARDIEVLRVERRQAVIAWTTQTQVKGKVFFRRAAGSGKPEIALETLSKSFRHQVILPNLTPGTRYTYWIDDPDRRFQFQTQPEANTPFSFVLVSGDDKRKIEQTVMSEIPDFILDMQSPGSREKDVFSRVRPYVPVFDRKGVQSPFLETQKRPSRGPWPLDWGELRLWVAKEVSALESLPESPKAGIQGVVLAPEDRSRAAPGPNRLKESDLFKTLAQNNRDHPAGVISFALVPAETPWYKKAGETSFLGLPMGNARSRVRMDVGSHSVTAVLLETGEKFALKEPPLKAKITCDDCRKLADKGAYTAAIDAYRNFIQNNAGHFQIDDAYFSVARLYDEKLFDFKAAVQWYERLIQEEEKSSLTPLARQRIQFLNARSDFDFKPLARFERIKKIEVPRKKNRPGEMVKVLEQARAIAQEHPSAVIAPGIWHWLGMQYRDLDTGLSVRAFEQILKNYPGSEEAGTARADMGDTHYRAGDYPRARQAYEKALAHALVHNPGLTGTIKAQIKRCSRNILRMRLAGTAVVVMAVVSFIILILRPRGISLNMVRRGGLALAGLMGANFLAAWVIHEQFLSTAEMGGLVAWFSLASAWAGMGGAVISQKLTLFFEDRFLARLLANLCGVCSGLVLFGAGFYLSVFYMNQHYLIIFKL